MYLCKNSSRPHMVLFLTRLTLICWLSACKEGLGSPLITACAHSVFEHLLSKHLFLIVYVLFTVFITRVYASLFLCCKGSISSRFLIGPHERLGWLRITTKTKSWCTCLLTSCAAVFVRLYCFKGFIEVNTSFSEDYLPSDHYCIWDGAISGPGSCSRCISES